MFSQNTPKIAAEKSGQSRREPKPVRKVSARYLKNSALYYVERYSATEQRLKQVMMRKVDKSIMAHGGEHGDEIGERAEFEEIVDKLIVEFVKLGYIDDSRFGLSKARRLQREGNSFRQIQAKLSVDGISSERIKAALETLEEDSGASRGQLEYAAAWTYARKKRIGPYRDGEKREDMRQRDLGAMARRGFGSDLAYGVVLADEIPDGFEVDAIHGFS